MINLVDSSWRTVSRYSPLSLHMRWFQFSWVFVSQKCVCVYILTKVPWCQSLTLSLLYVIAYNLPPVHLFTIQPFLHIIRATFTPTGKKQACSNLDHGSLVLAMPLYLISLPLHTLCCLVLNSKLMCRLTPCSMYPTGEQNSSSPQGPVIDERPILSQSVNSQGMWVVVLVSQLWQVWEYDLTLGY